MGLLTFWRKRVRVVPTCPVHLHNPSNDDPVAVAKWHKEQREKTSVRILRELRHFIYYLPPGEKLLSITVSSRLHQRLVEAARSDVLQHYCDATESGRALKILGVEIIDGG